MQKINKNFGHLSKNANDRNITLLKSIINEEISIQFTYIVYITSFDNCSEKNAETHIF